VRNLWKVEIEPGSLRWIAGPERLTTGANHESDISISATGKKLAFSVRTEHTRLWSIPFDIATGRLKGNGAPVTETGIKPFMPDLSPDGQKVVFVTNRAGRRELWEVSLKDNREKILAADDSFRGMPRWSPDSTSLSYPLFRRTSSGRPQFEGGIVLRAADGGQEQMLTTPATQAIASWDWSPDRKWILGGSDRQRPGRMSICLFPIAAAPHAETQMRAVASHPEENLYQGRFSPDQKWVSFIAAKANEAGVTSIYVVPVTGGEWRRITDGKYFDDKPRWSTDGRRLYFISNRTGFFNVWGIGFDPESGRTIGEPFRVTTFESPAHMILPDVGMMEMALAADRIILPIMEVSGGIWILENVER
jgi:Tol biopolymer transport system component